MPTSSFFITSSDGKTCTTAPREQNVGVEQTMTSSAESLSTQTRKSFTQTSLPTTFSTFWTVGSAPTLAFTALAKDVTGNAAAPGSATGVQVTFISTTSSLSSQTPIPTAITTASVIGTRVPLTLDSAFAPESLATSSTIISSSQTADQESGPTSQTNVNLAPATTPGAQLDRSRLTSGLAIGGRITMMTAAAGSGAGARQPEFPSANAVSTNGAKTVAEGGSIGSKRTAVIAGGVIGGLAAIFLIALVIWFCSKRLMRKRRSTLLTPLSPFPGYGAGEKGSYIMHRISLGPTTILEKMRVAVGNNYHRLRGRVHSLVSGNPNPGVDLDRGNPQFRLPDTQPSSSIPRVQVASNESTAAKHKFADQQGRPTKGSSSKSRQCNDPGGGHPNNHAPSATAGVAQDSKKPTHPAFPTRAYTEARQQRPGSHVAGITNPRRSRSLGDNRFLCVPKQNLDTVNPFSDSNIMRHDSASLAVPGTDNTISNASIISDVIAAYAYRESGVSIETSDTSRSKFRSDPSDVDRLEFLLRLPAPGYGRYDDRRMSDTPGVRPGSLESRYSSGVGSGFLAADWGDPGPDVGPAALGRAGIGNAM